MNYLTSISIKGQITIPMVIRKKMNLQKNAKLLVFLNKKTEEIQLKPIPDFFDLAKNLKVKQKRDVLKAREYMEKHYERS